MCEIVIPEIHTFKKLESSQSICNKKQNRRKSFATKTKIVANHLRRFYYIKCNYSEPPLFKDEIRVA